MQLLFYKGTKKENPKSTLWDNIICLVTRSKYSHVEISFKNRDGYFECWSSSTRDKGVRMAAISKMSPHWTVIPLTNAYVSDQLFIQERGKAYDYIGLLGTVTGLPWFSSKTKWFCSEIIAEALGLKNSWKETPESLYRLYKNG